MLDNDCWAPSRLLPFSKTRRPLELLGNGYLNVYITAIAIPGILNVKKPSYSSPDAFLIIMDIEIDTYYRYYSCTPVSVISENIEQFQISDSWWALGGEWVPTTFTIKKVFKPPTLEDSRRRHTLGWVNFYKDVCNWRRSTEVEEGWHRGIPWTAVYTHEWERVGLMQLELAVKRRH